jgi:tetratricopeptide (TPR) repeat protein
LSNIKELKVPARTSSFAFKGEKIDIREVGKRLNVDKVLEGSVRKTENHIRITAQLINIADGYQLWSQKYDRNIEDVFAIQDEISLAIVNKLKIKLIGGEEVRLTKHYTENLEAHNLYLQGRWFWNKRTEDGLKKSIVYFKQAIEKDPGYALAYAGMADAYNLIPIYGSVQTKDAFPLAKEAALKALEIDETLAEAHASLAWIKMNWDLEWEMAEKEFLWNNQTRNIFRHIS